MSLCPAPSAGHFFVRVRFACECVRMHSIKRAARMVPAITAREDHIRAHRRISRRHMLQLTAGGLALAGGVQSAWTQRWRIEALDPALDAIIDKSQTIQELASG